MTSEALIAFLCKQLEDISLQLKGSTDAENEKRLIEREKMIYNKLENLANNEEETKRRKEEEETKRRKEEEETKRRKEEEETKRETERKKEEEETKRRKEEEETKRETERKKEEEETKRKKEEEETKRETERKKEEEETKRKKEEEKTKRETEREKTKRVIEAERTARAKIELTSRSNSDSMSTIAAMHVINQMMDRLENIIPQDSADTRTLPQASTPLPSELIEKFKEVPGLTNESSLQAYACKAFEEFKDSRILNQCVDTHGKFFLKDESAKPELLGFDRFMARLPGYREMSSAKAPDFKIAEEDVPYQIGLVGFMELKATMGAKAKHIEQAMEYCRILLGLQPFRTCTFCVLTDLRTVKILEVTRTQAFIHNGTFIKHGLELLWYLMTTPNAKIFNDLPLIEFPNITYNYVKALGEGATSTVYQVKLTDPSLAPTEKHGVVKVYFDDYSYLMEDEKQKLLDLADYGFGIPKFIAQGNPPSILMTPYCQPIRDLMSKECEEIVEILKHAHSKNIIHRDLRQANILISKNSVVVNDWGFAVKKGVSALYQGTIKTASDRILTLLANGDYDFPCLPEDDLCSLVKLFVLSRGVVIPLSQNPQQCLTSWKQYWACCPAPSLLNALKAAKDGQHDEVAAYLCSCMLDVDFHTFSPQMYENPST